jgi:hypothetical protein
MTNTKVGQQKKDDPAEVARIGFDAMMRGDGDVVSGFKSKVQATAATITPSGVLADIQGRLAKPGSGKE